MSRRSDQMDDETLSVDLSSLEAQIRSLAAQYGLLGPSFTGPDRFEFELSELEDAVADGRSSTMAFTFRNPARSTDPCRELAGARSILSFGMGYSRTDSSTYSDSAGVVASYAVLDYYAMLRSALTSIAGAIVDAGYQCRVLVDQNSLVDKAAARRSGLGWMGKSTLILTNTTGPYLILGEIVSTAPFCSDSPSKKSCGNCDRCQIACPTGALETDYRLDAQRCLAWLIQKPGFFPYELRSKLGTRFYGCDECLTSCPVGAKLTSASIQPVEAIDAVACLDSSDESLLERFSHMYIPKRDASHLRRNLLLVLGNSRVGNPSVRRVLSAHLQHRDPIVRGTAAWAAGKHQEMDLVRNRLRCELVGEVIRELERALGDSVA